MILEKFGVALATTIVILFQVSSCYIFTLTSDGPVVLGGSITFRADLYDDDWSRPRGTFSYSWKDDALISHKFEVGETSNTTVFYTVSYPKDTYEIGFYTMQVVVYEKLLFLWRTITSRRVEFQVTERLNGNISIVQTNVTLKSEYVSSASPANISVSLRGGDEKFAISKNNTLAMYWFVDCKYYGVSGNLNFVYNFSKPDTFYVVEALVVISKKIDTSPRPMMTMTTTTVPSNVTTTTTTPSVFSITAIPQLNSTMLGKLLGNFTGDSCLNTSVIAPDPEKTYGFFHRKIVATAPVSNISAHGTNWIQPWDMLNLNVTCQGTGPFVTCKQFFSGKYNVTGNETCDGGSTTMDKCEVSIVRYFLEPSVYTVLVILENNVNREIYPITINIYKVNKQPQLSVIVVPLTCSLAAVVLVVFGISYYIQNRSRFTVEVANFDFGKSNPDMEYKTFMERLRDSIKNPNGEGSSGYKRLGNPENVQ